MEESLEIIYQNNKIIQFPYSGNTTVADLRSFLLNEIKCKEIELIYNKKELFEDGKTLSSFIITSLGKLSTEKIRVKIAPLIHINTIKKKVTFYQLENNSNKYELDCDILSPLSEFSNQVGAFFIKNLEEYNYKINQYYFYESLEKESNIFTDMNLPVYKNEIFSNEEIIFYFLLKNSSIIFYRSSYESKDNNKEKAEIQLRKNTSSGQNFNIIIQTYNSYVQELEVNHDMTVHELKKKIEETMNINENYQELLYLVYKLKNEKKLCEYYIRPHGIVFLRGYYFPIVFTDLYSKTRKLLEINIAEQVFQVKNKLSKILTLDSNSISLISNGRELEDDKYLIDYNVQKLQNIYFK
jgi:hypothetical protein